MSSRGIITEVRFTHPFKKAISLEGQVVCEGRILEALKCFPDLVGDRINVGITSAFGIAAFALTSDRSRIGIRLNPASKWSYHLIGHELTHFVQRQMTFVDGRPVHLIPAGEKQCDIWTLARDPLFCDKSPEYLRIPRVVVDDWAVYAARVGGLCKQAILKRAGGRRNYIVWLEKQFGGLA